MTRLLAALALLCACDQPQQLPSATEPSACAERVYNLDRFYSMHCDHGQTAQVVGSAMICRCPTADGGTSP